MPGDRAKLKKIKRKKDSKNIGDPLLKLEKTNL